jgi:hypothetical protein
MDLDKIAPGRDGIVLTQRDAGRAGEELCESGHGAHSRLVAVCADDPSGVEETLVRQDLIACYPSDDGLPAKANSQSKGVLDQQIVELCAPDSEAAPGRKARLNRSATGVFVAPYEPDAVEGFTKVTDALKRQPEFVESCQSIGQKSFSAGFVDRGLAGVCDLYAEAAPGRRDGACESRWTRANDKDVSRSVEGARCRGGQLQQWIKPPVLEDEGPIAEDVSAIQSSCKILVACKRLFRLEESRTPGAR